MNGIAYDRIAIVECINEEVLDPITDDEGEETR
jgi:hypothetical protein